MMQSNSYLQHLEVRGCIDTLSREAWQRRLVKDARRAKQPAHKTLFGQLGGILMTLVSSAHMQAETTPDVLQREDLAEVHEPGDASQVFATLR